jgi:hypothetical protein
MRIEILKMPIWITWTPQMKAIKCGRTYADVSTTRSMHHLAPRDWRLP